MKDCREKDQIRIDSGRGTGHLLRDGTRYRIRPIGRGDRKLIQGCFDALSAESRRLRFFGAKTALTAADLDFFTCADGRDHLALAAIRLHASGDEAELLGVARCIRQAPGSDTAELAMAVVDKAQGLGIGRVLLASLVEAARTQGIRRFRCEVMAANQGMRALADGLGSGVRWLDDGTLEYDYPFAEPPAPMQEPSTSPVSPLLAVSQFTGLWAAAAEHVCDLTLSLNRSLLAAWLEPWLDARAEPGAASYGSHWLK